MKFPINDLVEALRGLGYDNHKIRKILLGEGYGWQAIAEATVPPRTIDERIERLRTAGASIRTTAACVGIPKSTLHLRLSPIARENHNKRPSGRHYAMTQENVTALLMATADLTHAINEAASRLEAGNRIADAIESVAAAIRELPGDYLLQKFEAEATNT